jgi:predicted  nucleic acid-binding Zn-ribbon protein
MSGSPCSTCPQLRREINALNNVVTQLNRRIAFLRRWLAWALAGIRSTVAFIDQEQEQPSMPRRELVPAIQARLTFVADTAEGKN